MILMATWNRRFRWPCFGEKNGTGILTHRGSDDCFRFGTFASWKVILVCSLRCLFFFAGGAMHIEKINKLHYFLHLWGTNQKPFKPLASINKPNSSVFIVFQYSYWAIPDHEIKPFKGYYVYHILVIPNSLKVSHRLSLHLFSRVPNGVVFLVGRGCLDVPGRKLGSMVSKWVILPTYKWGINWGHLSW